MLAWDALFIILIYFACVAGVVLGFNLLFRTTNPLIGCLSVTIVIFCVVCCYSANVAFVESLQLESHTFKLVVGGEGF